MLNSVVEIQLSKVEAILPVALLQHVGGKVGYEEAKARRKVVGVPNLLVHFLEANIFAVARQNSYRVPKLALGDTTAF